MPHNVQIALAAPESDGSDADDVGLGLDDLLPVRPLLWHTARS